MLEELYSHVTINTILIVYICAMSVVGLIVMKVDKVKAIKHKWRISETALLTVAFFGGGIGSFIGMRCFRHKTRHLKFNVLLPLAALIYALLLIAVL